MALTFFRRRGEALCLQVLRRSVLLAGGWRQRQYFTPIAPPTATTKGTPKEPNVISNKSPIYSHYPKSIGSVAMMS